MERLRVRCPCCGMTPFADDLAKNKDVPVELKVFLLKFGGKMPAAETGEIPVKKGRGSAPGYMEMVEVTDLTPEQGQVFKAYWIARAAQVLDAWTE